MRRVLVGIGNDLRGDDGVGLEVVRRAQLRVPPEVGVVLCGQEATPLLDVLDRAEGVVVVDAVASGAAPGLLHRFDASAATVPARSFRSSTHAFGVGEAIELARALGQLPPAVVVIGVEATQFGAGEGLSAPVRAAVEPAVRAVLEELVELERRP